MVNGVAGLPVKNVVPASRVMFKHAAIAEFAFVVMIVSGKGAETKVFVHQEMRNPAGCAVSGFATKNVNGTVAAIAMKSDETVGNADGNGACRMVTGRMTAKDTPMTLAKRLVYLGIVRKMASAFTKFKIRFPVHKMCLTLTSAPS